MYTILFGFLFSSFLSSITLIGQPAEVYLYGGQQWLFGMATFFIIPIVGYIIVPFFRGKNYCSAYQVFLYRPIIRGNNHCFYLYTRLKWQKPSSFWLLQHFSYKHSKLSIYNKNQIYMTIDFAIHCWSLLFCHSISTNPILKIENKLNGPHYLIK